MSVAINLADKQTPSPPPPRHVYDVIPNKGTEFPIVADNLRFASWNEDHKDDRGRKVDANGKILLHPEPLTMDSFEKVKVRCTIHTRLLIMCIL